MKPDRLHSSELGTFLELSYGQDIQDFCRILESRLELVFGENVFECRYRFVTRTPDMHHEMFTDLVFDITWPRHVQSNHQRRYTFIEPAQIFSTMVNRQGAVFGEQKVSAIVRELEHLARKEFLYGR